MAQRTTRMHINFKTNAVNLTMKQPKHDISDAVTLIFSQIYLYSFFLLYIFHIDQKVDLHCCIRVKKSVIVEMGIAGRNEKMEKQLEKII